MGEWAGVWVGWVDELVMGVWAGGCPDKVTTAITTTTATTTTSHRTPPTHPATHRVILFATLTAIRSPTCPPTCPRSPTHPVEPPTHRHTRPTLPPRAL